MYKCKFCEKEYDNSRNIGGHVSRCPKNPNIKRTIKKVSKARTVERKEYTFSCRRCGKEYSLTLTKAELKKNKYSKHCSRSCANGRVWTNEINAARSKKLKGNVNKLKVISIKKKLRCEYCKQIFIVHQSSKKKLCSKECSAKYVGDKLRGASKNVGQDNPMYGRVTSTKTVFKTGRFFSKKNNKEVYYRSSYEERALQIFEDDEDVISYNCEAINIPYKKGRSTVPDYIVKRTNGICIIEVKPEKLLNKWDNDLKAKAMQKYADKNNMTFEIWTEKKLSI